jgi:hypothetical protein
MNPQARTKQQQDSRDEKFIHAQRTGEYLDSPGAGGIPMMYKHGRIYAVPGYIAAAKRRRDQRMGRMGDENETT